jgi:hypothetical protein
VRVARAAAAGVHLEFEVAVRGGVTHCVQLAFAERRAPEVGVEQHAGRVDHWAEQSAPGGIEAAPCIDQHVVGLDRGAGGGSFTGRAHGVPGAARA